METTNENYVIIDDLNRRYMKMSSIMLIVLTGVTIYISFAFFGLFFLLISFFSFVGGIVGFIAKSRWSCMFFIVSLFVMIFIVGFLTFMGFSVYLFSLVDENPNLAISALFLGVFGYIWLVNCLAHGIKATKNYMNSLKIENY